MRYLLFLFSVVFFSSVVFADTNIQHRDLSKLATQAKQNNLPILFIVSQHNCPFCIQLKQEIIFPMQRSGDYTDKMLVTEILLDDTENILDFQGKAVKPGVLADLYRVWVTPTLLFVNHTGKEIHKRMLGVNTIEMYGYYLDESLSAALKAVRKDDQSYMPTLQDIKGDAPGYDQLH